MISTVPSLLVGNPQLPAQNMKELIALAKAKPGALTIARLAASARHCISPETGSK